MSSPGSRFEISLAQVAGSALAAVSAAVVASFLGVGGTVLGAALGSTVATIAGAVYAHTFRQAGQRLGETRVLTVVTKARAAHEQPGPGDVPVIGPSGAASGEETAAEPSVEPSVEPSAAGRAAAVAAAPAGERPRWMSGKALLAMAVAAFVIAMVVISAIELTIGRPISGGSGTTVSKLVRHSSTHHSSTTRPAPAPTSTQPATSAPVPPHGHRLAGAHRDAERHADGYADGYADRSADHRRAVHTDDCCGGGPDRTWMMMDRCPVTLTCLAAPAARRAPVARRS